jgi:hypothetical protein
VWPGPTLFQIAHDTWQSLDVYPSGIHGLDTRALNLSGEDWTLQANSNDGHYWVTGLDPGDTITAWTDLSQNAHFGISTRIDSIADPVGPIRVVDATLTRAPWSNRPNGSPVGDTSQLPSTLTPGTDAALNLTWSLNTCHPPGTRPTSFSIRSVDLHETVLGVHRTRTVALGYTLNLIEPSCPTG